MNFSLQAFALSCCKTLLILDGELHVMKMSDVYSGLKFFLHAAMLSLLPEMISHQKNFFYTIMRVIRVMQVGKGNYMCKVMFSKYDFQNQLRKL